MKRIDTALVVAATLAACSSSADTSSASGADLVVNELRAVGTTEWLEIANKASTELDLGGYGIADTDKSSNGPKYTGAKRFPAGTKLAPKGYVLVLLSKSNAGQGVYPKDACLPESDATCFYAEFGVSAGSSESVYLLDPQDRTLSKTTYPTGVAVDAASPKTACRIPDMTGDFTTCTATPGKVNAP
ncbi:MAG: lamin tail domain-containing protein [Polyangiaceae bacterium]|nr:lamin tail domain-containing protein [Polyangiaceae bacterium]